MTAPSIYRSPAGERAVESLYDSMLARWPVPHTEAYVPTRHGDTFVITSGDESAPPLVLLHGAGTNSAMWMGDVAAYSSRYRVIALDLPGEPGRSAPARPSWYGPAYSDWLGDALDALGVGSTTIIGVSQGAWTALKFSVANATRVDMGERDALRDADKVAARMRALLPRLTVSIVPDAGHAIVDAGNRSVPFLEFLR